MAHDILDQLLTTLEMRLHAFGVCEIGRGKRLAFGGMDAVVVHLVIAGSGVIEAKGASVALAPGSIVVVPTDLPYALAAAGTIVDEVPARDHAAMLADGLILFDAAAGGAGDLRIVSGTIAATHGGSFGLFDRLRRPVIEEMAGAEPVERACAIIRGERERPGIGTHGLIEALMKECLVELVRAHFPRRDPQSPLFARLSDARLTQAVLEVIGHPAAAHSVERLAATAGMSRSAFAKKFNEIYDQTPMEFVARARLHRAAALLIGTDLPVALIAASLGYASRSHFSRAFRASYGDDPSSYRKRMAVCRNDPPGRLPPRANGAPQSAGGSEARIAAN